MSQSLDQLNLVAAVLVHVSNVEQKEKKNWENNLQILHFYDYQAVLEGK